MKYRPRIYYTETDKSLMWERWQKGDSLHAIAQLFDRSHGSIAGILSRSGGIRPRQRRRSRLALALAEREEISRGVVAGQSLRSIAASLGRAPSTLSREINRNGGRRALQSVVIELDESGAEESDYIDLAGCDPALLSAEKIRSALLSSGLWTVFRTRPYDKVPQSDAAPRSIFVTAIDTRPLAGNPEIVVAANQAAFSIGVRIVSRLTDGVVYLCTDSEWSVSFEKSEQIRHTRFSGPHPAGLPGTHIHHIDPVGPGLCVSGVRADKPRKWALPTRW